MPMNMRKNNFDDIKSEGLAISRGVIPVQSESGQAVYYHYVQSPSKASGRRLPHPSVHIKQQKNHHNMRSNEDDQRLAQRRERNREAAARCRKRRLDLINELSSKVQKLENEKSQLNMELDQTMAALESYRAHFEDHLATCKADVKPPDLHIQQQSVSSPALNRVAAGDRNERQHMSPHPSMEDCKPNVNYLLTQLNGGSSVCSNGTLSDPIMTSCTSADLHGGSHGGNMSFSMEAGVMSSQTHQQHPHHRRPQTLPLESSTGVPLQTPSVDIPSFSLLNGSTGFTPTADLYPVSSASMQLNTPVVSSEHSHLTNLS